MKGIKSEVPYATNDDFLRNHVFFPISQLWNKFKINAQMRTLLLQIKSEETAYKSTRTAIQSFSLSVVG